MSNVQKAVQSYFDNARNIFLLEKVAKSYSDQEIELTRNTNSMLRKCNMVLSVNLVNFHLYVKNQAKYNTFNPISTGVNKPPRFY